MRSCACLPTRSCRSTTSQRHLKIVLRSQNCSIILIVLKLYCKIVLRASQNCIIVLRCIIIMLRSSRTLHCSAQNGVLGCDMSGGPAAAPPAAPPRQFILRIVLLWFYVTAMQCCACGSTHPARRPLSIETESYPRVG